MGSIKKKEKGLGQVVQTSETTIEPWYFLGKPY